MVRGSAQRERRLYTVATPARPGPCGQFAAEHRHPLAHPDEATPATLAAAVARAVIDDLENQHAGRVGDGDVDAARAGVLERVGQRLLDHPVRRQVEPRWQWPR